MALRSLVVKLKALPLRVPGFPTDLDRKALDDLSRKIAAARDPTKYKSGIELLDAIMPLINQKEKLYLEHRRKTMKAYRHIAVLTGAGCLGAVGYATSSP
ncbi:hypothetical protein BS78_02G066900 [Paspalum vaginatum]|nr:hypothetical protein BS78_02G066900 [Paspalum vaginatum]